MGVGVARLGRLLDWVLGRTLSTLKWLAIPIGLLLFLQWPLRDYVKAYSREANDLGQWLFALYVAAAVTAATRAGTHLAVDTLAKRYSARTRRRLRHICNLVALAPWAHPHPRDGHAADRRIDQPLGAVSRHRAIPATSSSRRRFG